MPLWGARDAASNTSQEWVAAFNKKANTANRTAFYGNTTANSFINNQAIGVFGVSDTEMGKRDFLKITSATVVARGNNYANGDIVRLATGVATTNAEFIVTTGAANTSVTSLVVSVNGSFSTPPTLVGGATNNKTVVNASANGLTVTVVTAYITEGKKVNHSGWNVRKVGFGGRAGRVQYETLVAGGITTDGTSSDDPILG